MNPNTGQPIPSQNPINPPIQDSVTDLTSEQKTLQAEKSLQQGEQGLGDIFGNEELSQTTLVTPSQVPQVPIEIPTSPIPVTESVSQIPSQSISQPTTIPQMEQQPVPIQTTEQPVQVTQQISNEPQYTNESIKEQFSLSQPIENSQSIAQINTSPVITPTQPIQTTEQPIPVQTPPVVEQQIQQVASTSPTFTPGIQPTTVPQVEVQPVPVQTTEQPIQTPAIQAGSVAPIPQIVQVPTQTTSLQKVAQTVPPVVAQTVVKKGSKISPLKFAIGCGIFGFFLIGAIGFLLFFALQNPTQFQGIIPLDGIKTGLKLFTGLFFGMLFLGSFILLIFNIYKLTTQKTGSKIKYLIGLLFGALLLGGTVFGGIVSFNKINEMIETTGSTDILTPYIKFKDEYKPTTNGYPIIAPTKVLYGVNDTLLTRFLTTNFVNKNINSVKLDCGNKQQILNYNQSQKQFAGQCLYMKKGDYPIKVITNITDKSTGVTEDVISDRKNFSVFTEIALAPSSGTITHNDAYDEIIIGKAPTKLNFDSTSVFTDIKLPEYKIERDLDGDGTFDKSDLTVFSHQFREPKIQNIYYTLPGIGQYSNLVYQIDLRVLQNDVPICTITANQSSKSNTTYNINTTFDTKQVRINSYMYRIKNLGTNKFLNNISNKRETFEYDFLAQGNYIVYLDYVTEDGKQGNCESDTIEVGASTFKVDYTLQYKGPNDKIRKTLTNSGIVSFDGTKIATTALPVKLLLTINGVSPASTDAKTIVKLDNQIIQTPNGKSYEITLHDSTHEQISINVNDPILQATTLLEFPIHITQEDIMGKLSIFPSSVGTSPFEVTLDASTTTLTDQDDEIIYFTWDYGDGEIIKNSSQARTKHTYAYDENSENGGYNPKVTITTKKGKTATFGLENPILVKKPILNSTISIDSHPAQIANIGDRVNFSLHTDGTPTNIKWNFGTSDDIECSDRSCASVPMFFNTAGTYTITATITYKDLNTSTATTKLIVEK